MERYAIARIKEECMNGKHSEQFNRYVNAKYSKHGFKREHPIEYNREWTPEGSRDKLRWIENVSDGLRYVGAAHDLVRLQHTGWFTDDVFQDETVHGEVYQLPARGGVARYVPHMVDQRPPVYGLPTSTVHSFDRRNPLQVLNEIPGKTHFCPAQEQGNMCGECRACWDKRVKNVSYHKH